MPEKPHFHIIGAGPVGCATALQLAKEGYQSTIYERGNEILSDINSYPIGVNPRGLNALSQIDPSIEKAVKDTGRIVDSWDIYSKESKVASQLSGVVYGTSRSKVNMILFEEVNKNSNVKVKLNHKLISLDFKKKELIFDNSGLEYRVDASKDARIVAADGVNSIVRQSIVKNVNDLKAKLTP
jgi:kynurenine 3-monooxygenase